MYEEKLSIIVPVYNCEKHLSGCIESILNQTYMNFELLLVDDGSTDNSGMLCDDYMRKDNRIQVIHQTNSGVSVARNTGIRHADGKYIMFVDSDDCISDEFLYSAVLDLIQTNTDLYISGIRMDSYDGERITKKQEYTINRSQSLSVKQLLEKCNVDYPIINICGPCCKLYKKSVIDSHGILFNENLSLGEDTDFNLRYLKNIDSVYFSSSIYYFYRRGNENSLFSRFHKETYDVHVYVYDRFRNLMQLKGCNHGSMLMFEDMYCDLIVGCIHSYFRTDSTTKNEKKELLKKVADNDNIQKNNYTGRSRKNKLIISLLQKRVLWAVYIIFYVRYRVK